MKRAAMSLVAVVGIACGVGVGARAWAQPAADPGKGAGAPVGTPSQQDELERVVGELKGALKEAALVRVLGFYTARVALLERIEKEIPALAAQAKASREAMERQLGPGAQQIELALVGRGEGKAAELEALKRTSREEAGKQKLDEAELGRVFERNGYMPQQQPPRNIMLLLATNPENLKKPERVYDEGFVTTLPLASGVDPSEQIGTMKVPTTFALVSGEKPGDRLTFAYGGYAPATITVTVDPANGGTGGLTPEQAVQNVVGSNAGKIKAEADKARYVDTPNGRAGILPVEMTVESGGKKSLARGEMYLLPVGDKVVGVAMTVQVGEGEEGKAGALWGRFEGLFERVRGSVVVKK